MASDTTAERKARLEKYKKAKEMRLPQVAMLHTMGYSSIEIATSLKVSRETIRNEIKELKANWAASIANIDLDYFIGQLVEEAKIRKKRINDIFNKTENYHTRLIALKQLAEEDKRVVDLLQSVGKLFEKPKELVVNKVETAAREYFEEMGSDGITKYFGALGRATNPIPNTKRIKADTKH